MKQLVIITGGVLVMAVFTGCSTVDPMTLEQTARDRQTYTEKFPRSIPVEKWKLAVLSTVVPHESAREAKKNSGKPNDEYKLDEFLAKEIDNAIAADFSNLGWFETVDRKHGVALSREAKLANQADGPSDARYLLTAESSVLYVAKQGWKRTSHASKARGAQVKTTFHIVDIVSKEAVLVKTVTSTVADMKKKEVKAAITEASQQNVKKFARLVSARFLPDVHVKQMRGNGQYAQVAMGKNYQAVPAVTSWKLWPYKYLPLCYLPTTDIPASKVDFFYNQQVQKNGKQVIEPVVFAHGTVIRATQKDAWVEIDNYENANVHIGHGARVSEEDEAVQALE